MPKKAQKARKPRPKVVVNTTGEPIKHEKGTLVLRGLPKKRGLGVYG